MSVRKNVISAVVVYYQTPLKALPSNALRCFYFTEQNSEDYKYSGIVMIFQRFFQRKCAEARAEE